MSRRTSESNKAILAAWNKEQELVRDGKGTREWTPEQQQNILDKGKAYDENGMAFEGQHMKSVEKYPEYQGDPGNIQFLTRAEHLEAHDGNWQNPTNWYFNPVIKEKLDFGDEPFIPCEVISLPEPVVKIQTKQVNEEIQEPAKGATNKIKKEASLVKERPKSKYVEEKPEFGQRVKAGLKSVGKAIVEFQVKHPTATKILKSVVVVTATAIATVVVESSRNNSSDSKSNHPRDDGDYSYDYDETSTKEVEETSDEFSENDNYEEDVERAYTPNDVPTGKQRYHYKDGSVRWKDKSSYHRGGNSD